jgi:hypothetical protein
MNFLTDFFKNLEKSGIAFGTRRTINWDHMNMNYSYGFTVLLKSGKTGGYKKQKISPMDNSVQNCFQLGHHVWFVASQIL